jgi:ring-1,2-phenylacetyl-CoA epoxidase subunit PaaE
LAKTKKGYFRRYFGRQHGKAFINRINQINMAVQFYPLKIKQITQETADCVSLSFDIPESLGDAFAFKEGQNITIKKAIKAQEVRRSYSLCTAPHENEVKVAIKKISGGLFSTYANEQLREGDTLDVMPPTGNFNGKNKDAVADRCLFIAAGSGITPVLSILKHILHTNPKSECTLLYGNKSRSSIIFFEQIEALKNRFMQRLNVIHVLSREKTDAQINHGRISPEKLEDLQKLLHYPSFDSIYLCGPETMIFEARDFFERIGVERRKIHFELFSSPGQVQLKAGNNIEETQNDRGLISKITVRQDGRTVDFDLAQNGSSILEAALLQGADLPYACKGGVCCTCRAKLIRGQVTMDVNYALEPEEVEQGFILTCQSHPVSEYVEIDFDIK